MARVVSISLRLALTLALSVTAASCGRDRPAARSSSGCATTGDCSNGSICNASGACVACAANSDCPAAGVCSNGACGPCTTNGQCGAGAVCAAGACGPCTANTQCEGGAVCTAGSCGPCTSTAQCGVGEICADGACGVCTTNEQCGEGAVCVSGVCGPCTGSGECSGLACIDGACAPCARDDQCVSGEHCGSGVCGGCTASTQCVGGRVCLDRKCSPCSSSTQCATGQACLAGSCGPCGTSSDCAAGSACVSGACGACTTSSQCRAGEACIAGTCGPCTTAASCGGGRICLDRACVDCTSSTQCDAGQVCLDGDCGACTATTQCPAGQACRNGSCGTCTASSECRAGEACLGGTCGPCSTAADCPATQACVSGRCGPCTANLQCRVNETCTNGTCGGCTTDAQCPAGRLCVSGACNGCATAAACNTGQGCVAGICDACDTDADCREGEACDNGTCAPCTSSAQCDDGLACISGACGPCTLDSQCEAPLTCGGDGRAGVCGTNAGGSEGLFSLDPPTSFAGQHLWLDGNFAASPVVIFPSGVRVSGLPQGTKRIDVVVPATATAGNLVVESGGVASNALTFRRARTTLAPSPLRMTYPQANGGAVTVPEIIGSSGTATTRVGPWIYIVGGSYGQYGGTKNLERGLINADGTLNGFRLLTGTTETLVKTRSRPGIITIGNYVYVTGGADMSTPSYMWPIPETSVERAFIHPDGSVGQFELVPIAISARWGHQMVVAGNWVYILGGYRHQTAGITTAVEHTGVERAPITADGIVGTFTGATAGGTPFTTTGGLIGAHVLGRYLYVIDTTFNNTTGVRTTRIRQAALDGEGNILGQLQAAPGTSIAIARSAFVSEVVGDYLYIVGSAVQNPTTPSVPPDQSVERAKILGDGSLGPFVIVPNMASNYTTNYGKLILTGNQLHFVGGGTSGYNTRIQTASFDGGALGNFEPASGHLLATARSGASALVVGRRLYVVGGKGAPTTVESAPINADGSLGALQTVANNTLDTGRSGAATLRAPGVVYLFGGENAAGTAIGSIERADIQNDQTLSDFIDIGLSLGTPRSRATAVATWKNVYVLGGRTAAGTATNKIEKGAAAANGALGGFADAGVLQRARAGHASAVAGGFVYVLGGENEAEGSLRSVERAAIQPDGALGPFSVMSVALLTPRRDFGAALVGKYLYVFGGRNDTGPLATVERAEVNETGGLGAFEAVSGSTFATPRSAFATARFEDWVYAIGGETSGATRLRSLERAPLAPLP